MLKCAIKCGIFNRKAEKKEILRCHDKVLWDLLENLQDEDDDSLREISSRCKANCKRRKFATQKLDLKYCSVFQCKLHFPTFQFRIIIQKMHLSYELSKFTYFIVLLSWKERTLIFLFSDMTAFTSIRRYSRRPCSPPPPPSTLSMTLLMENWKMR